MSKKDTKKNNYEEELQQAKIENQLLRESIDNKKNQTPKNNEKKLSSHKKKVNTEFYDVVVYNVLEGRITSGTIHTAKSDRVGRTKFLFNLNQHSNVFTKIAFPRTRNLKYENKYKELSEVVARIKKVKELLESEAYSDFEEDFNEWDLEEELLELTLLSQKMLFPQDRTYVQYPQGRPTLYYASIGSVFLPICYGASINGFYIAPDIAVENAQILDARIDEDYPDKEKNRFFTKENLIIIGVIAIVIISGIAAVKYLNAEQEVKKPLKTCQVDLNQCILEKGEIQEQSFEKKIEQFDDLLIQLNNQEKPVPKKE